jgi:hypothetical protein
MIIKKILYSFLLILILASCKKQEKGSVVQDFQLSITYFSDWLDMPFTLIVSSHNKENNISILSSGIWEELYPAFPPAVFVVSEKDMVEFYNKLYKLSLDAMQSNWSPEDVMVGETIQGNIIYHTFNKDTSKLSFWLPRKGDNFYNISELIFSLANKYIKHDPYASAIEDTESHFDFCRGCKLINKNPVHIRLYGRFTFIGNYWLKKWLDSTPVNQQVIFDLVNRHGDYLPFADILTEYAKKNHNIIWVVPDSLPHRGYSEEENKMIRNDLYDTVVKAFHPDSSHIFKDLNSAYLESAKTNPPLSPLYELRIKEENKRLLKYATVPRAGKLVPVPNLAPVPDAEIKEDNKDSNKALNPDTNQKQKEIQQNDSVKKRK